MTQSVIERKPGRYDYTAIEAKWQRYWEERGTFRTPAGAGASGRGSKPKYYILDMFPYPSGAGLHVGHPLGYCATDIVARYKRMLGYEVLHPMGFDSFGLPAEQYAIETGVHPAVTTQKNIERYRQQLRMFGFSYDWSREVATSDPKFYRYTQWMFLRMFESWYDPEARWVGPDGRENAGRAQPIRELVAALESGRWSVGADGKVAHGPVSEEAGRRAWSGLSPQEQRNVLDGERLAFLDEVAVNWCPALGTVLANEEVDNEGRSERGGHKVYRRPLKQWMLRITRYAERLLGDLEQLDWPEAIKLMQRNWVGRSTGVEVTFPLVGAPRASACATMRESMSSEDPRRLMPTARQGIRVFTTRPDTLFGATYMVLAPEHPLVARITTAERRAEVEAYVAAARNRSDLDRTAETKEKTGVFTGAYAINPVNGWRIPIWVADYVLMGYGTGAIMAVPGSDERDFAFAVKFDLPIVAVVRPTAKWIEAQLQSMTARMEGAAARGFQEVERAFPELRTAVEAAQARSEHLSEKTICTLLEKVGVEKLIGHYVRHPKSWGAAYCEEGWAVNSPDDHRLQTGATEVCNLNGLATEEAKARVIAWLEEKGLGRGTVNYKLRDWIFSRQKYWGEPFPILHGADGETRALEDRELPLELPPMEDFKPTPCDENDPQCLIPTPPLGRAKEWVTVQRDGKTYTRDMNTMPQWAGSCWYYLRFIDPHNERVFCDPGEESYWMPVDLYVGGAEHAVLHLLYARFWHKVLYDLGYVSTREPFRKLFNQGMIQGFAFETARGTRVFADQVEERGAEQFFHRETGEPLRRITAKMSKSLKNVVNPDQIIAEYGADTFRLYEMYMGPLDAAKPWNTRDVPGLYKLCQRVWRLVVNESTNELSPTVSDAPPSPETLRALHKMLKRVTEDLEQLKFNTAIAAFFDFVNTLTPMDVRSRAALEPFILAFAPFAPHLAEELWQRLGHSESLAHAAWPAFDPALARDEEVEIAVQVTGKVKARIMIPADADEAAVERAALANEQVQAALRGKTVRKVIVVTGRLVNVVAG